MARKGKRRKFSNSQIVVVRFCDRKIVGKVVLIRPVGKKFFYDVEGEDGKIYTELLVDSAMNHCIDTYLLVYSIKSIKWTRLVFLKLKMTKFQL